MEVERITVVGLGLMGASLCLALKASAWSGHIAGFARKETARTYALECGMCDTIHESLLSAVRDADIVVLCVPVCATVALVRTMLPHLKSTCILTDVGSTKQVVQHDVSAILGDSTVSFVGSHPIAGSEKTGIKAGISTLYRDAMVVVCPSAEQRADSVQTVCRLWRQVGARIGVMDATAHDRLLARTSHVPHLLSTTYACVAGRDLDDVETLAAMCGSGYRSMTRLALGSEEIWRDIITTNKQAILDELQAMSDGLETMKQVVQNGSEQDIERILKKGRASRLRIEGIEP